MNTLSILLTFFAATLCAQDLRFEGAKELRRKHYDYQEGYLLAAPIPRVSFNYSANLTEPYGKLVRGETDCFVNEVPGKYAPIQVFENLRGKIRAAGYETLYVCRPGDCGQGSPNLMLRMFNEHSFPHGLDFLFGSVEASTLLTASKQVAGKTRWLSLAVASDGHTTRTYVINVVEKEMPKNEVKLEDARLIAEEIRASGKAALYGIHFPVDKSDILPESAKVLAEVAAYLKQNPQTRLIVAGHTDGDGGFDYNLPLSSARADAVRRYLIEKHGVAAARLRAFGAGMAAPAASNASSEGKERNRRVELVPF